MKFYIFVVFIGINFSPVHLFADCIEGNCIDGWGKMVISQGYEYEGQWKNGKPHGKGTLKTPYRTTISGDNWVQGQLQGEGVETYLNGRKYMGQFKNTRYNGVGTDRYPDGRVYIGEYVDGHPSGKGRLALPDGSVYEGEFKDGRPHGYGIEYSQDGRKRFAGQWNNGREVSGKTEDVREIKEKQVE